LAQNQDESAHRYCCWEASKEHCSPAPILQMWCHLSTILKWFCTCLQ